LDRTSFTVEGVNFDRVGRRIRDRMGVAIREKAAESLTMLPLKKYRNQEARVDAVEDAGKILGEVRERRK
jgi:hypothetical protein